MELTGQKKSELEQEIEQELKQEHNLFINI